MDELIGGRWDGRSSACVELEGVKEKRDKYSRGWRDAREPSRDARKSFNHCMKITPIFQTFADESEVNINGSINNMYWFVAHIDSM